VPGEVLHVFEGHVLIEEIGHDRIGTYLLLRLASILGIHSTTKSLSLTG
jgi:hypothetical protein